MSLYPIDEEQISVYGQNYGGFLGLKMMVTRGGGVNVFSCGLIRSPVIDWLHYGNPHHTGEFAELSSLSR